MAGYFFLVRLFSLWVLGVVKIPVGLVAIRRLAGLVSQVSRVSQICLGSQFILLSIESLCGLVILVSLPIEASRVSLVLLSILVILVILVVGCGAPKF